MKYSSKFKLWAGAALFGAAALAGGPALAQTLKIGAINPYSGPLALYGTEVTRGYELAVTRPTRSRASPRLSSWPSKTKWTCIWALTSAVSR
jgi:hypothetical protein